MLVIGTETPIGLDQQRFARVLVITEGPRIDLPSGILLDADLVLGYQDVVLKRVKRPIMLEFHSAIVVFGGGRENFNNHGRIDQDVLAFVCEHWTAAHDDDIRVSIHSGREPNAKVRGKGFAGGTLQRKIELSR